MIRHSLTAAALAAALAVPAFAQQQPSATPSAPATQSIPNSNAGQQPGTMGQQADTARKPGFAQNQSANEWRASKLIGTSVYGPDNASIGEINDVIIGSDGQFKAAIVGVGGFLGMGEKNVALPFEALSVSRKANSESIDKVTVSYSKDELKNAPTFAYYEASGNTTTGSGGNSGLMNRPANNTAPAGGGSTR
ncbi:MAG: PRC-barrel domain-containing protein [Pseudolabrys sp.]